MQHGVGEISWSGHSSFHFAFSSLVNQDLRVQHAMPVTRPALTQQAILPTNFDRRIGNQKRCLRECSIQIKSIWPLIWAKRLMSPTSQSTSPRHDQVTWFRFEMMYCTWNKSNYCYMRLCARICQDCRWWHHGTIAKQVINRPTNRPTNALCTRRARTHLEIEWKASTTLNHGILVL